MTVKAQTLKTAGDLIAANLVSPERRGDIDAVAKRYAIAVTGHIANLITSNDASDPIARQFIPNVAELTHHEAETADPIGDDVMSPLPGIVHRYPDRVLLKISHVCPVYCRFCFRREMVGPNLGDALDADAVGRALDYIRSHTEIWEVILTGGDPFVLSPRRVADITKALGNIPHVKIIRWHTRVPIAEPSRVTDELVAALTCSQKAVVVAIHTNHVQELVPDVVRAIARLIDGGVPVVSQTVLLAGVNNSADALEALFRRLVEVRVKPYYLHHGDLAPGTAHFRTTLAEGRTIMEALHQRLSGLALPQYVLDIPGGHGKVPVQSHVTINADGRHLVRDPSGKTHIYVDASAKPAPNEG